MRGNTHVRFGGRAEETDRPKSQHRASARPNHTHATLLLQAGISPKVVSARLGHASVKTTLDVYAAVLPAMDADAAARFEAHVWAPDDADAGAAGTLAPHHPLP